MTTTPALGFKRRDRRTGPNGNKRAPSSGARAVRVDVTKIVIAGGGFAGLYAAMYFDRTLARRGEADVVLISRENFILFTPMLHEVAAGDLQPSDIVSPLRRILRHVKVVEAEVEAIDLRARQVSCVTGRQP